MSLEINCDTIYVSTAFYERQRIIPMGTWTSYPVQWTATGTAPAIGNGTLTGQFALIGLTCCVRILLTTGTTTAAGVGVYRLSLPFPSTPFRTAFSGYLYQGSPERFYVGAGALVTLPGSQLQLVLATPGGGSVWGATTPGGALGAGDQVTLAGTYEVEETARPRGDPAPG